MNKKGNIQDAWDVQKILGVAVFMFLIVGVIVITFMNNIVSMPMFQFEEAQDVIEKGQNFGTYVDWIYPFCLFVLMIFSIIAARAIPSNSGFFILGLLLVPFIGFMISIFSEIMEQFFINDAFSIVTEQMPITSFMLSGNVPLITGIIYTLLVLITLYAGKSE